MLIFGFITTSLVECQYRCTTVAFSGPFSENDEYLVVADYNQQNIYQMNPDSGEVRAIPMSPCHPVSVTFDSCSFYMICIEDIDSNGDRIQYHIRGKTFNEKTNQAIYNAQQSMFA